MRRKERSENRGRNSINIVFDHKKNISQQTFQGTFEFQNQRIMIKINPIQ